MTCPKCNGRMLADMTRNPDPAETTRRRTCRECGYRFVSIEMPISEFQIIAKAARRGT